MPIDRSGACTTMLSIVMPEEERDYLTFTSAEDDCDVSLDKSVDDPVLNARLQYRIGSGAWEDYEWNGVSGTVIKLPKAGDSCQFRAKDFNETFSVNYDKYYHFDFSKKVYGSGSIMTLLDRTDRLRELNTRFCRLFNNVVNLLSAPSLPAIKLFVYCYAFMFAGSGISTCPKLPAKNIDINSYYYMFGYNYNLIYPSEMEAVSSADYGIHFMYSDCGNLEVAPDVSKIMKLGVDSLKCICRNCRNLTTPLVLNPSITSMPPHCLEGAMKHTSITEPIDLSHVTEYGESCLKSCYEGCKQLKKPSVIAAKKMAPHCMERCYYGSGITESPDWSGVEETEFYCFANCCASCLDLLKAFDINAKELKSYSYLSALFNTSLKKPVNINSTSYGSSCLANIYSYTCIENAKFNEYAIDGSFALQQAMNGTHSLNSITVDFSTWGDREATKDWVKDVSPAGTFYCPADLPRIYDTNHIPVGWTVQSPGLPPEPYPGPERDWLTFTSEEAGSLLKLNKVGDPTLLTARLEYRKNMGPWKEYAWDGNEGELVQLTTVGDYVSFRAVELNSGTFLSLDAYYVFTGTGRISSSGELCSLSDPSIDLSLPLGSFSRLFFNMESLSHSPKISNVSTSPQTYSLNSTFNGCVNMRGDVYLAPDSGYSQVQFAFLLRKTKVDKIKVKFHEWIPGLGRTSDWVAGVPPGGTFECPADLPVEFGDSRIPHGWYVNNGKTEVTETEVLEACYRYNKYGELKISDGLKQSFNRNVPVDFTNSGKTYWIAGYSGAESPLPNPTRTEIDPYYKTKYLIGLFENCSNIEKLDLSLWDLKKCNNFNSFARNCASLKIVKFNKSVIIRASVMAYCFSGCENITSIDLTMFDFSDLRSISYAFANCTSVTEAWARTQADCDKLNASEGKPTTWEFKPRYPENDQEILDACYIYDAGKLSLRGEFYSCINRPVPVDFAKDGKIYWEVGNPDNPNPLPNPHRPDIGESYRVLSMEYTFYWFRDMKRINLSQFDLSECTNLTQVFRDCVDLETIIPPSHGGMIQNFNGAFVNSIKLNRIDLSMFSFTPDADMLTVFRRCHAVTEAYARTQADADKLNASVESEQEPDILTWRFTVHPDLVNVPHFTINGNLNFTKSADVNGYPQYVCKQDASTLVFAPTEQADGSVRYVIVQTSNGGHSATYVCDTPLDRPIDPTACCGRRQLTRDLTYSDASGNRHEFTFAFP